MDSRLKSKFSFGAMTRLKKASPIFLFFLFVLALFSTCSLGADTLTPTQPLVDGETLLSAGARFEMGFFSPVNSNDRYIGIWYYDLPIQTIVWVANRNYPIADRLGNLSITANGTLIVSDQTSRTVAWSSASSGLINPVAQLLDNGNFVVKEANSSIDDPNSFAWQTFDNPTDNVLPEMKFGWSRKTGYRNLTAWTSVSDPAPSEYVASMDVHGYPQIFLWAGSHLLWRSGPWNGLRFSGVPEQMNEYMFMFNFVATPDEVYYTFELSDPSILFRITMNESGNAQGLVWIKETNVWNVFWSAPKDQCDVASPCGPNGVCNPNEWPICSCPQGFEPKNPANWALRDGSDGCVRKTALDCRNGTDGFVTVSGAKLPDTSSAAVNMSLSLDQCRVQCLSNCSCVSYASANITNGIGCIFWNTGLIGLRVYTTGGQDLYVRVAAADLVVSSSYNKKRMIIILLCLAISIAGISFLAYFIWRKLQKPQGRSLSFEHYSDEGSKDNDELELPLLDLDTISTATDNFSYQNMLGKGGFGVVYKGKLADGQEIAVKRLSRTSLQGTDEFKNEVNLIAKLQHRNLVRLLGCCIEGEERMLVYEYMPYKSLDALLFGTVKGVNLDWDARYNIITGIARGLLYLHQDSRFRIIHRDLKASNILLDKEMNPKISDFGLARIFGGDEVFSQTRKVVGTYGYMSPEYAMDGIFSVKSDVFSFGVLLLEIISGQKNKGVYLSEACNYLLGNAWRLWNEGRSLELIDPSIGHCFSAVQVMKCIKVGLLCVQEFPEDRPPMSSIVIMLGTDNMKLPEPKEPGYVSRKWSKSQSSWEKNDNTYSINDVTLTMIVGR